MLHDNETNVDVQRLMHEIRASVASRHPVEEQQIAPQPGSSPGPTNGHPVARKNQYHVSELLRFHGHDFVRNAYRAVLCREPDEPGMAYYLEGLASGHFNKIDVLASMRSSPEGRSTQVQLDGLSLRATVRRLGRLPFVGYFVRLGIGMLRLPHLVQHLNRLEFYNWSQQRTIADRQDQHHKELSEALQQISAQILEITQRATEQQRANETALAQQAVIEERFVETRTHFDESTAKLASQLTSATTNIESLTSEITSARQEIASLNQTVGQQQQALNEQQRVADEIQPLRLRQDKSETELLMQERRLTVLLEALERNSPATHDDHVAEVATTEQEHRLDALYASFEDQFRGPCDEVSRRLQVYIPVLKEAKIERDVLDLGCGRGEWLELLQTEGIDGRGVDHNRVFIERCRRAGLHVTQADALVHLRSLPDESLNAVTAFHIVEHVPFEMLINLIDEVVRTLRRGGMFIAETPNPENFMVGSCNFYADPTHRNPIPSNTLQFLFESRGLKTIDVLKLRSWDEAKIEGETELVKRFNEYFYSAPDYAVIAGKP